MALGHYNNFGTRQNNKDLGNGEMAPLKLCFQWLPLIGPKHQITSKNNFGKLPL